MFKAIHYINTLEYVQMKINRNPLNYKYGLNMP